MNLIIVILSLGILIALHEYGHYGVARLLGMKVLKYSIGFGKPILNWTSKKTDINYQLGMIPLGGFVQVKGMNPFEEGAEDADSYQNFSPWKRALVIIAGPLANLLIAWLILFSVATLSGLPEPVNESGVGSVSPNGAAAAVGLQPGDKILQINGVDTKTWVDLVENIEKHPGKNVLLIIERDGKRSQVQITPQDKGGVGKIGVGMPQVKVSLPPGEAAVYAARKCVGTLEMTLMGLGELVRGKTDNVEVAGPVKITQAAQAQLEVGVEYFLAFMAFISLLLFLFNLLPIPALDGGRTVFLLYEVITRKRVNKKVDAMVTYAFFILLLGTMMVVSGVELFEYFTQKGNQ